MFLYDLYEENWQKAKGKGFLCTLLKCDIDRGQVTGRTVSSEQQS
nr:MAG TPA: hypothetical protein [Caudoviricetes sp.]